jgi:hypothetical protein
VEHQKEKRRLMLEQIIQEDNFQLSKELEILRRIRYNKNNEENIELKKKLKQDLSTVIKTPKKIKLHVNKQKSAKNLLEKLQHINTSFKIAKTPSKDGSKVLSTLKDLMKKKINSQKTHIIQ